MLWRPLELFFGQTIFFWLVLLFVAPVLTMRLLSEERRSGTIEMLMTAPVTEKYDRLIAEGLLLQKRWGTPEDVGKAVAGLAKGYFQYSTGAVIEVGGGFSVLRL